MQHGECNFKKIHFKSIYKPRGFHMWGMVLKYIRASPTGILNRAPILLFWCHSKNNNNSIGPQLKSLLYGGPQIFPLSPILKGCVRSSLLPGGKKSLHNSLPHVFFHSDSPARCSLPPRATETKLAPPRWGYPPSKSLVPGEGREGNMRGKFFIKKRVREKLKKRLM